MSAPGLASGVTRIQHSERRQFEYPGATLRLSKSKQQLTIVSPDGRDTLIVGEAACSWVGELQRCLLGKITLQKKDGAPQPIALRSGHRLREPHRREHAAAVVKTGTAERHRSGNATVKGTFINVTGTFDEVTQ